MPPFAPSSASAPSPPEDAAQIAAALGLSAVAFRQALSRLRDRFRSALRAQIADTLREPTDEAINEELRTLRSVLAVVSGSGAGQS